MKQIEELNKVYEQLHKEKTQIMEYLDQNDFPYVLGYYPFNTFKKDNEFYIEQYPIPVITVGDKVDIGVDIHQIFFEMRIDKETALSFDFYIFEMYQFEVYGSEDFYNDYYFDNIDEINNNILHSDEDYIGVSILINKDKIMEDVINILELLDHL